MRKTSVFLTVAALVLQPVAAQARNIVLSNDDGLTSNVLALYRELKAQGHDVIVSVPCTNQSGMGAAMRISRPITPLDAACLNDSAQSGDPGAGPMTRDDLPPHDFFYVAGTPVMALLYGLDIAAQARWGAEPELVLSGPNEGQNVGAVVISSGTVSVAQFAALRGLPAIALSAGRNTEDANLANPLSAQVARLSAHLVASLDVKAGQGNRILPEGLALNVNFPDALDDATWRVTRFGSYDSYRIAFAANMAEDTSPALRERAAESGVTLPPLPGVIVEFNEEPPAADQEQDESIVIRQNITISPMQPGYDYSSAGDEFLSWMLADIAAQ